MKKSLLFSFLFAFVALTFLPSCNEESDHSADKRITENLPGFWELHDSQKDEDGNLTISRDVKFYFTSSNFSVEIVRKTLSKTTSYSVRGTWNVKNEILQLRYDLNSLTTLGYSSQEITALKNNFSDNNAMLDDLKDNPQAYGMPIELSRPSNTSGMMKLTKNYDFAGTYNLSTGTIPD